MIERVFLTKNDHWRGYAQPSEKTKFGFLSKNEKRIVEVKLVEINGIKVKAEIKIYQSNNIPDPKSFNYLISIEEAESLLSICYEPILNYTKYYFGIKSNIYSKEDPQIWYVKEYEGPHKGIVVTGVNLNSCSDTLYPPDWVGAEITDDPKYKNYSISELKLTKIEETTGAVIL